MKVDYGFILAAGFGTRMGEIGKHLPKTLWPVFNKRIIDLQIIFLKNLGIHKIFMNVHFLSDQVLEYMDANHPDVKVLVEDEILDSGGGLQNFVNNVENKGIALVVNGDQFLHFNYEEILKAAESLDEIIFFGTEESTEGGYNKLVVKNRLLTDIVKNSELDQGERFITWSGLALYNLAKLQKKEAIKERLFEGIGDYKKNKIEVVEIVDYEYWDFGTVQRFINSSFDILFTENKFKEYLKNYNCFDGIKFSKEKIKLVLNEKFIIYRDKVSYGEITSSL